MDSATALAHVGGVARAAVLLGMGVAKKSLAADVQAEHIYRVARGCYSLASASPTRISEVAWNGFATCTTALKLHDLPTLAPDNRVHLALSPGRNLAGRHASPPDAVVRHFNAHLPLRPHDPLEALDSSYLCLLPENQLVAIDAALNRGLLQVADIANFSVTSARRRSWLMRYADARTQSPIETLARVAMIRAGLKVQSQVYVSEVGRVDFLVDGTVIVEVDGRTYHSDERQFAQDRRRDRAAAVQGLTVMRFTYDDVRWGTDAMIAQLRQLLAARRA